ncbi:MAG: pirin family protein, partial [Planctomyces sp.]
YLSVVEAGQAVRAVLAGRYAWLQVLRGGVSLNGVLLGTSDGAAVSEERELMIEAEGAAEVMLFDLG